MQIPAKHLLIAAAAIGFIATQTPAHAVGADPTVDFGSLKAEFAAEDAGATYGDKRRKFRSSTRSRKRGLRTRPRARRTNFSRSRRRK